MKNKIQFFAMAACCAAVTLFSGCEKEQYHVLTASIENASHVAKVHLEDEGNLHFPHFDSGDSINVNGYIYTTESSGKQCKFTALADDADPDYYAVYPAKARTSTSSNNQPTIILPAEQKYRTVNGVQRMDAPMCGASNKDEINFHNLCSVMKVVVKNPTTATAAIKVTSIEISSDSYRLSYPDGLQISSAMDPEHTDHREWLNAETSSGSTDPQGKVTLTGTSAAGSIAVGSTETFYVYLPTFKPATTGDRVALKVKVNTTEGSCLASYTRTVRLDSLQRNMVNGYNFSMNPALRQVEGYLYSIGSGQYVSISKQNEGATDQFDLGTNYTSGYTGGGELLTNSEWFNLLTASGNGLAMVGSQLGWVVFPADFTLPTGYSAPTTFTVANSGASATVSIVDKNGNLLVTTYTTDQWSDLEDLGAAFIPVQGSIPTTKDATDTKNTYYCSSASNNICFYFYIKCTKNDPQYDKNSQFVIYKSRTETTGKYTCVRTIEHM